MRISDWSSDVGSSDLKDTKRYRSPPLSVRPELVEGPSFLPRCEKGRCFDKLSTNGRESFLRVLASSREPNRLYDPQQRLLLPGGQPVGPRHLAPQRHPVLRPRRHLIQIDEIGRASCRERVCK